MGISQIGLVTGIMGLIEHMGVKDPNTRQLNSVIEAANLICEEFGIPNRPAVKDSGIQKWLQSDDTGMSSKYMASVLVEAAGLRVYCDRPMDFGRPCVPHDPADFGRCVRMLDAAPELSPHIPTLLEGHGYIWRGIAQQWSKLEMLYREEYPSGRAPKLYDAIRQIHNNAVDR